MLRRILLAAIVFGAIAAGGAGLWVSQKLSAPGAFPRAVLVDIARGTGTAGIAQILTAQTTAANTLTPLLYKLGSRLIEPGKPLQAGEYEIPAGASMADALRQIKSGKTYVRKLTVPEGWTTRQILDLVQAAPKLSGDLPTPAPAEGTLLPDTYHYTAGDTRGQVLARMKAARDEALSKLWAARPADFPLASPDQAVTLASIIERETGKADERPHIAAVFYNRLRLGMKLQSDPTVIYALSGGLGRLDRPLTGKDLTDTNAPYNTYLYPGLPPAPIANPGLESLRAAFAPATSDDLYFVADGTGGHVFAKTLAEHNRNVAAWRKIQKSAPPAKTP